MKILVDADACPVKAIIVRVAKKFNIPVFMVMDYNHEYTNKDAQVITVDKAQDSADLKINNLASKDDVVITADYGLSSLLIAKSVHVLHVNGFTIDQHNIDRLLFDRFLHGKARKSGQRTPVIKKRTKADDQKFEMAFHRLLQFLLTPGFDA